MAAVSTANAVPPCPSLPLSYCLSPLIRSSFCEHLECHGVTMDGGFADYAKFDSSKVFPFFHMSDDEATLCEPAACAMHGLDKLRPKPGIEVLMIGAGPSPFLTPTPARTDGVQARLV